MKDGIVWSGIDKADAELFYKRKVLPADPDAEPPEKVEHINPQGVKSKLWQIKAKAILGSKPVIIKKE